MRLTSDKPKYKWEYYNTIERFKSNGMSDNQISKITGLPIDYIKVTQRVVTNIESRRISFTKRDFDLTEIEIENIGEYDRQGIGSEIIKHKSCRKSFTERLQDALNDIKYSI